MTELDYHILCADAAAQTRDAAGLAEHAPLAEEGARRLNHRLYLGIAHRAQGIAQQQQGWTEAALDRFDQALALFEPLGTRWQIGRTLVERAGAHASAGDLDSARADYARALEAFEAIGAAPAAEQVRRALQSLT